MSNFPQLTSTNRSPYFDFVLHQRVDHAEVTIQFFTNYYTTKSVPATVSLLEVMLPRIFSHKCFNDLNQNFKKEAQCTELGHLFEHILLEFLCMNKYQEGQSISTLKGLTEWNWKQDPKGIFHIHLNSIGTDEHLLKKALTQTSDLMNTLMLNNLVTESIHQQPQKPKTLH